MTGHWRNNYKSGSKRANAGGNTENVRYARDLDEALSVLKSGKTRKVKRARQVKLPTFSWDNKKEPQT